jgi:hypothetical protein
MHEDEIIRQIGGLVGGVDLVAADDIGLGNW